MGGFSSSVQAPQTSVQQPTGGKGGSSAPQDALRSFNLAQGQNQQAAGQQAAMKAMGDSFTHNAVSGQPRVGAPNQYPNTVGINDNTTQSQNQMQGMGQGKGGGTNQYGASGKGASGKGA